MIDRRELLAASVSAGAASMLVSSDAESADQATGEARRPFKIIDTNVSLFQWPFRRLPLDEVTSLVEKMRSLGINQAWAGSFEGVLQRDVTGVNARLAEVCRQHAELVPIGSINLELPDWQHDLRRCFETHRMPGIRLHPNYHGYTLADPRFTELLRRSASADRFVQIACSMEDTRTQHSLVQVADVDLVPLPKLVRQIAGSQVQVLNYRGRGNAHAELINTPQIYFDCARVDGTDGITKMVRSAAKKRVLFGTHAPFLIPESALIRTYESNLSEPELHALLWTGAESL